MANPQPTPFVQGRPAKVVSLALHKGVPASGLDSRDVATSKQVEVTMVSIPSPLSPIETHYKGYRFRSRLEARWAVFFDAIQKDWRYEVQGYQLPDGRRYLPDFVINDWRDAHIEIKPGSIAAVEQGAYIAMLGELEDLGLRTMLIVGDPWPGQYSIWRPSCDEDGADNTEGPMVFAYDRRDAGVLALVGDMTWYPLDKPLTDHEKWPVPHAGLEAAYTVARSARFEHGESG